MIKPMADWMSEYTDEKTGLPHASYDLWEEVFLTTTFTTSTVYAALRAAADLADAKNDKKSAVKWRSAATDIAESARRYLYNSNRQAFYKGVLVKGDEIVYNDTIDASSIFGAFMFGLFPVGSPELTNAVKTFTQVFPTGDVEAYPRYENDPYHRVDPSSPGNWWFITTLWMAQYYLEVGQHDDAHAILAWVNATGAKAGILAEQVSPIDQSLISPSPLTWSHAEYVATLLDTIKRDK